MSFWNKKFLMLKTWSNVRFDSFVIGLCFVWWTFKRERTKLLVFFYLLQMIANKLTIFLICQKLVTKITIRRKSRKKTDHFRLEKCWSVTFSKKYCWAWNNPAAFPKACFFNSINSFFNCLRCWRAGADPTWVTMRRCL